MEIVSGEGRLDILRHLCPSEVAECFGGYMESLEAL